jgi:hypothetical protein
LGLKVDLQKQSYSFRVNQIGAIRNRFWIILNRQGDALAQPENLGADLQVYQQGQQLIIENVPAPTGFSLYDLSGRAQLKEQRLEAGLNQIKLSGLKPGIYQLQFYTTNNYTRQNQLIYWR